MPIRAPALPAAILAAVLASSPAFADTAKQLGKFDDWTAFTFADKSGKVCYTAARPKQSINGFKGRGETYVSVTHRPNDKSFEVISVTLGFTPGKGAPMEIDVGGAKFDLYSAADTAYTRDDKAVVQAMLKGKTLIVHAAPAKGGQIADTYSLNGFAKALAEINKNCGVK